ncbi:DUF1275 family protein [Rhodococcoides trifolii]|uniref:DUF1275 family protein n=1 Tax=Rhodococcoides trifolii TaxID=908250 RepID=A0A917G5C4_9NOCA|nr:DUF1275 family protein [Rhodococcus trifolii]
MRIRRRVILRKSKRVLGSGVGSTKDVVVTTVVSTKDVIADLTVGEHKETTEVRLSSVLAVLAGFVGAASFIHSAGYFVTFMTGNTERMVLGWFTGDAVLAYGAMILVAMFLAGVVVASLARRHLWSNHPHGATNLTALALTVAVVLDLRLSGTDTTFSPTIGLLPISFVAFAMGALNTSFVKKGEVSIPLSYVTGTLVKLGQGIERHISGGTIKEWSDYGILYASFTAGAVLGGIVGILVGGGWMLLAAALAAAATSIYTYRRDAKTEPLAPLK